MIGIDPASLFGGLPNLPDKPLLKFLLSGPSGSIAWVDGIVFPGLVNGSFDIGYFDGWELDTSLGGAAIVSAFDTRIVPEPGTFGLFAVGIAGLGVAAWRHRRRH